MDSLDGVWKPSSGAQGGEYMTINSSTRETLTIRDDKAEWSSIPYLSSQPGTGAVTVDRAGKPATIELKVGDKSYKGIYQLFEGDYLTVVFAEPGGEFPVHVDLKKYELPKGFKGCRISFERTAPPPPPAGDTDGPTLQGVTGKVIQPLLDRADARYSSVSRQKDYQAAVGDLIQLQYQYPRVGPEPKKVAGVPSGNGAVVVSPLGTRYLDNGLRAHVTVLFHFEAKRPGKDTITLTIRVVAQLS